MTTRLALAAIALSIPAGASAPLAAQTAQTAAAEPEVLNNANPDSFQVYGLAGGAKPASIKDAKVQFGKAIRIDTPGSGDVWSVGVNSPLAKPVRKGDKIVIAYYARVEKGADGSGAGKVTGQLQLASAPYTQVFGKPCDVTGEWKLCTAAGHADRDYAQGELAAALHLNTARQTLDIGAMAVLNYGQKS
jgi:hypothetical protein